MIDAIGKVGGLSLTGALDGIAGAAPSGGMSALGGAGGTAPSMSFAEVMGSMASDAMNSVKNAEVKSFEGIRGQANTREVVDAVMSAEQSLQTAIAFRDKIVSAYLEVVRMPI
ncbi:flagellar hook-basal body complex protein FliE [Pararhizobium sp.]|uniref:flagellar hook-basal body complex protein FliE n=1 Tax=Pararhizobium sp. TaxID=1977563 RepID=UPI00272609DF|nr:flagellar hook-basal body complex protein FliE [Pararhizobium sp.]MDO9416064.1 flagellar hook-basal body complex protein FliE [Pararhizobium sp.]